MRDEFAWKESGRFFLGWKGGGYYFRDFIFGERERFVGLLQSTVTGGKIKVWVLVVEFRFRWSLCDRSMSGFVGELDLEVEAFMGRFVFALVLW